MSEQLHASKVPLKAIWDLRQFPITFDFAVFLSVLDCYRQIHRPEAGIDLTIRADAFRAVTPRDKAMSVEEKRWRLKSIILDLCALLPTIESLAVTTRDPGPFEFPSALKRAPHYAKRAVELFREGANPQVLKAPLYAVQQIRFPRPYVTMTLRTSNYFPDRNADLHTWHRFSKFIQAAGYTVVIVPDQGDLFGERLYSQFDWSGTIYEAACLDLRLRLALYENADMNIGSSNGPVGMMFYSQAPLLQFDQLRGGVYNREFWEKSHGFPVGEQFPWCRPDQRLVWTDSSYENMVNEWTAWKSR